LEVLLSWNGKPKKFSLKPKVIRSTSYIPTPKKVKVKQDNPRPYKYTEEDKLIYHTRRDWFLKVNQIDIVALLVFGKFQKADKVHHSAYRGANLNKIETFIATTAEGDRWIHANQDKAKELGFLQ